MPVLGRCKDLRNVRRSRAVQRVFLAQAPGHPLCKGSGRRVSLSGQNG
jgi:hypothetical protein